MSHLYHATPYDISASGFYFSTYEEYAAKAATHCNAYGQHVEEYEIQFIDGEHLELFEALGINQANLADWFEHFEDMDNDDAVVAIYLITDRDLAINEIIRSLNDVMLFHGTVVEYAEDYLDQSGMLDQIPKAIRRHIDVEAFARDLVLGGDVTTFEMDGTSYVVKAH